MKIKLIYTSVVLVLISSAIFYSRNLYFNSTKKIDVQMAISNEQSSEQAGKDGVQQLSRLISRFPNAKEFKVTWKWERPNYYRQEGIIWNREKQTFSSVCAGEPCPISSELRGFTETYVLEAASKNQTMWDIVAKKHLK